MSQFIYFSKRPHLTAACSSWLVLILSVTITFLTFSEAGSVQEAVDRCGAQNAQQREKIPHFCAWISLHRVLTPSLNTHGHQLEIVVSPVKGTVLHWRQAASSRSTGFLWLQQSAVRKTRYCEIPALFLLFSPLHKGNPPQRQNKTPMEAEYSPAIRILIFLKRLIEEVPLYIL